MTGEATRGPTRQHEPSSRRYGRYLVSIQKSPDWKSLRSGACGEDSTCFIHDGSRLERWAIQRQWNPQRLHWLHLYLWRFTIIPSSPDLCRRWAEVMVAAQAAGRRIECADAWIAASALLYSAPLITHNRADYVGVPGLTLISHQTKVNGQIHDLLHHIHARGSF